MLLRLVMVILQLAVSKPALGMQSLGERAAKKRWPTRGLGRAPRYLKDFNCFSAIRRH